MDTHSLALCIVQEYNEKVCVLLTTATVEAYNVLREALPQRVRGDCRRGLVAQPAREREMREPSTVWPIPSPALGRGQDTLPMPRALAQRHSKGGAPPRTKPRGRPIAKPTGPAHHTSTRPHEEARPHTRTQTLTHVPHKTHTGA